MVSDGALRAMRRKAGDGRTAAEPQQMSSSRAWRVALPKAAEECAELVAAVRSVAEARLARDVIARDMAAGTLLVLLEGSGERFGVAMLDAQVLAGLVEVQTTGRVVPRPAPARTPTRTDATICADLLDRLLELYEQALDEMPSPPDLAGYRYATHLADPRLVEITLAEGAYRVFTITVDLGRGAKQGDLRIALPDAGSARPGPERDRQFQQALEARMMDVPAELDAVLHRFRLTLDDVIALKPGDVLSVPRAALGEVRLEAGQSGRVSSARLGQLGGFRAVRILEPSQVPDRGDGHAFSAAAAPEVAAGPALEPLGELPKIGSPEPASPPPGRSDA